jgi:2-polyprenyl-3-methyl-5-hydroxy-6-metoxy-1,4-benzoquinol methylase
VADRDDSGDLNREVRAAWEANARFWDERIGEGNRYQLELIMPATERLLALQPGEVALDAACGNGNFSRRMVALGARVVAFDFSSQMIDLAWARTTEDADEVEYCVIDATEEDALLSLGAHRFDAAVCSMALMDMAEIEPLVRALSKLLKPGGRFVFSVLHPAFSAEGTQVVAERDAGTGATESAIRVAKYIRPSSYKGEAILGQPELHPYFHRPLSVLFGVCFEAGFVLDGFEEPVFEVAREADPLSWESVREVPPALVARMRLL